MLYQTPNPHGGDLFGRPVEWDFSVNTNPLGTPQAVVDAVRDAAGRLCQYPDPCCRALVDALADYEGLERTLFLCGGGAAELIYAYCRAIEAGTALVCAPTFSEYETALQAEGCRVLHYPLREEEGFALTGAFLEALKTTEAEAVFLCNPNNPTGRLIDGALLADICQVCQDRGIRLFVDECFLELSDGGRRASLTGRLESFPGLFLLKAFTKSYGMAGLRLGYCMSGDRELLARMGRMAQPWNVSLPAQAAGVAALRDPSFLEKARALIQVERPRLVRGLEERGLRVCPSQANYLLLNSRRTLDAGLLEQGILIRNCANYQGLCSGWYRVAVKTPEKNRRLLQALSRIQ